MRFRHAAPMTVLLFVAIGADAPTEPSADKLLKPFQGTWSIESIESDGIIDREAMAQARYHIRGNSYALKLGDRVVEKGFLKLEIDGRDWTVDLYKVSEKTPAPGIYEFREGTLRLCFAPPGEPRPHAYLGRDGNSLLVLTRPKSDPVSSR